MATNVDQTKTVAEVAFWNFKLHMVLCSDKISKCHFFFGGGGGLGEIAQKNKGLKVKSV